MGQRVGLSAQSGFFAALQRVWAGMGSLTCLLCAEGMAPGDAISGREICPRCHRDLPWFSGQAKDSPSSPPAQGRGALLARRAALAPPGSRAALQYAFPVDVLVRGLKFHGRLDHAAVLGGLLAEALIAGGVADPAGAGAGGRPDLILPMPLHDNRLKERGFNQAAELALVVSRATRIPFAPAGTAVRSRDTAAQSGLDRAKRAANVRGAFAASPAVRGLRIAVLDDVVTTGATAGELARVLKRAGAKAVTLWAVCAA